jgi:hypothetical protein
MTSNDESKEILVTTDSPIPASALVLPGDAEKAVAPITDGEAQARARLDKLLNDYGVSVSNKYFPHV